MGSRARNAHVRRWIAAAIALPALGACSGASAGGSPPPPPPSTSLPQQLETLSTRALYFGHQSVGGNVMQGTETLLAANSGPEPTVYYPATDPARVGPGVWAHQYIGANGDPVGKIAAFEAALNGGMGAKVDVAFMKFCFADFWDSVAYWSSATPADLFAQYQAAIARLKTLYPAVRFVHFTVPLWTATDTNARREAFSNLIRATYGAEVLDIADLEATDPAGAPVRDARGVRALYAGYTSDGGHLNASGQDKIARALIAHLAALP